MKTIGKLLTLAALFILAATMAQAATWHVSAETGGAARSADGTKEKPWKDLQVALDRAAAGDTILIAAGNYLGTSDQGFLIMKNPVNLRGGYTSDFSSRDVVKNRTMIQPPATANGTSRSNALLTLGEQSNQFNSANEIVIDGIIFDRGFSNGYHATRGKPAGVDTGTLMHPPAQGENGATKNVLSIIQPLLYLNGGRGKLAIQNCVFTNSANYAIRGMWATGNIRITNNLFVANAYAALEITGNTGSSNLSHTTIVDFGYNTILFSWSRTNDLQDMGYGYRYMTGVNTDVHHSIIGASVLAGLDRGRVDSPASDAAKRKTGAEDNAFFLNRQGDICLPSGGGLWRYVNAAKFEDIEELYKYERNKELPAAELRGKINESYLAAFLSMQYSEDLALDRNSSANQFRSILGQNLQGTVTTKVDMYANRYPLDDTMKLFGAVAGFGAQAVKN